MRIAPAIALSSKAWGLTGRLPVFRSSFFSTDRSTVQVSLRDTVEIS